MGKRIGIDIGGTSIRAALIDEHGNLSGFKKEDTPESPEQGIHMIKTFIGAWLKETSEPVGVAAPGPLNTKTGIFLDPPNLPGWHNFKLKERLEELLEHPCIVENDANAAAVAEFMAGAGKSAESIVYVTISTGVGAGIITGGHLLSGAYSNGGEVGNMIIADNGPSQQGMNIGSWESLASGKALGKRAAEKLQLTGGAPALFEKIEEGSAEAQEIFNEWVDFTARGLANLIHTVDPEVIILGGGVLNKADLILPPLKEALKGKVYASAVDKINLVAAALGGHVGVIGAANLSRVPRL
ncbi:ROK family protein [Alkalicoccus daliensis]|uniref:Glucokinase n=1 Tax=Alkalicoccus daliensis TaxID=745820 RepID=A0A1H0J5Q9_9BACI|nr:ROK family protein [Alkalicoccus daliensis]SDO38853.1 glucokinase [Alkalicoccus daliensis]